jgi:hypothetical protein
MCFLLHDKFAPFPANIHVASQRLAYINQKYFCTKITYRQAQSTLALAMKVLERFAHACKAAKSRVKRVLNFSFASHYLLHRYIASTTEAWELSSLAHKVNNIHSHLMKQLTLCLQHIGESEPTQTSAIHIKQYIIIFTI